MPAEIRAYLTERFSFAEPRPLDAILADVADMMRRWTLHATHPRYFGLFNPDVHEAGVWGDALAALYNAQVGGWWHAPAAFGSPAVRACITSYRSTEPDVDALMEELQRALDGA